MASERETNWIPRTELMLPVDFGDAHATVVASGSDEYTVRARKGSVFLNGNRIGSATVRPGDKLRFGETVTYRVTRHGFRREAYPGGMSLSFRNVSVRRGDTILFSNVRFEVKSDEFVGILGPSGCGKTTFLEILSLTGGEVEGTIFFDLSGQTLPRDEDAYQKQFAYVPQDDILYADLTVWDNLRFAAKLRVDDRDDPAEAIEDALESVGLWEHRFKRVRLLSGGQRKRVGIAVELLKRPRLLLLDEPTSGLDPAMESSVMARLKTIARQGTTVLCTTHQMANVEDFDKIVAFGKNEVFVASRESVPAVDRLMESVFGQETGKGSYATLYEKLGSGEDAVAETGGSVFGRYFRGIGRDLLQGVRPLTDFSKRFFCAAERSSPKHRRTSPVAGRLLPRGVRQTLDVTFRCFKEFFASFRHVVLTVLQPVVLGFPAVLSQYDESSSTPLCFFLIVIALWLGLNNSVRTLVGERRNFIRDHLAGLPARSYLAGKTLFFSSVGFVQLLFLLGTLKLAAPIFCKEILCDDLSTVFPGALFFVLFLAYLSSLGLGLLVSTCAKTENIAIALLPPLIMLQILLSMVAAGNYADSSPDGRRIMPVFAQSETMETPSDVPRRLFDTLSLFCYSRPALFLLDGKINAAPKQTVAGQWAHSIALAAGTWVLLAVAFSSRKKRWRNFRAN